jgi:hypothetical protein
MEIELDLEDESGIGAVYALFRNTRTDDHLYIEGHGGFGLSADLPRVCRTAEINRLESLPGLAFGLCLQRRRCRYLESFSWASTPARRRLRGVGSTGTEASVHVGQDKAPGSGLPGTALASWGYSPAHRSENRSGTLHSPTPQKRQSEGPGRSLHGHVRQHARGSRGWEPPG